ncbi:hypothetical protein P3T36_002234 [Kitasatospora sp. MAP12-15]|uniref:DUF2785 domain-containing protein n=1 Tax=unclassified Kitasatospora TaxID=2633591 RepID=UPI0024737B26|nr:DUF2785 domain-containing protein [Kitasatospora sp. MAP12-44]MDH6108886.1 hypothetical protein [Kitasatospora sp. MAP12-44]
MTKDLVDWPALAAEDFPFPGGVPLARLGDELSAMLVSPDPVVRDEHAYTAAARWIRDGQLDEILVGFGDAAATRLQHPEIQARTFAPLILRCVLTRSIALGTAPQPAERWYAAFAAWFPAERDTRGRDDTLGWLHAVAHGADAAAAFAQALPARRPDLLELCAHRMTAPHADYRYAQLEDARLARAITLILLTPGPKPALSPALSPALAPDQAPDLTVDQATRWLSVLTTALEGGGPGAVPPWAFNTFATLQSLHLHLTRGLADGGIPPHAELVAARVTDLLRLPYSWLG